MDIPPPAGNIAETAQIAAQITGDRRQLRECHDCGCLQTLQDVSPGTVARCRRCGAVLRRARRDPLTPTLALACTGLVLLAVASGMPFLKVELMGRSSATHFTTGATALDQHGLWELGLVVLATTVLAPLAKLVCTTVVIAGLRTHWPPRWLYLVFRSVRWLRPWAMIEVYMLGIFVAYTKLIDLAQVDVGVAAYALAALMLTMAAADAVLDPDAVWEQLAARGLVADPARMSAPPMPLSPKAHPVACHSCNLVTTPAAPGERCPRCGAGLHPRKPNSLQRTWALVIAAAILYIPANLFPVLTLISLGRGAPSTIVGGVEELVASGMWPLALLVFVASITVPVLKILGLSALLFSVHRRSIGHLRDRTRLFRLVDVVGRWSMIDVFMISILVGLVQLGFVANVQPGIGAVAFAGVVILTMLAAMTFDPRLMWDAAGRNPDPAT